MKNSLNVSDNNSADMILINGKIITVDSNDTIAEAVALRNGKIKKVGSSNEIKTMKGEKTTVIDLKGKTMLPGLMETHTHFHDGGTIMTYLLDFSDFALESYPEILNAVQKKAKGTPEGQWVIGKKIPFLDIGLWRSDGTPIFTEKTPLTRWDLDKIAPKNPVLLIGSGNHVALANSKALELANISRESSDPQGGKITKDSKGEPNGILIQAATGRLDNRKAKSIEGVGFTVEQYVKSLANSTKYMLENGITTVHDIIVNPDELRAYQEALRRNKLPLRFCLSVRGYWEGMENVEAKIRLDHFIDSGIQTGFGNEWLKIVSVKLSIDGPGGIIRIPREQLIKMVTKAHEAGLQCWIHAVSVKGLEIALDGVEEALKKKPMVDHRHRIEHGGNTNVTPSLLERMSKLNVIPSVQVVFLLKQTRAHALSRILDKNVIQYPLKSLKDKGLTVILNSDWPAISTNPFLGIYAAVARCNASGDKVNPEESITVMDAIRMYTINNAFAAFEENIKGSIEPGKLADLTVVSEDPLSIPPERLSDIKVEMTIIDGKIVYSRENKT